MGLSGVEYIQSRWPASVARLGGPPQCPAMWPGRCPGNMFTTPTDISLYFVQRTNLSREYVGNSHLHSDSASTISSSKNLSPSASSRLE